MNVGIICWDGTAWQPLSTGTHVTDGTVRAAATYNGQLFVAGSFTTLGGLPCNGIAFWDGYGWQDLKGGVGLYPSVRALAVYDGRLIVGNIHEAQGAYCPRIGSWDGTTWRYLGSGMDSAVYALTVYKGDLIAAGAFTTAGGVACRSIARWDGVQWHPLGTGPAPLGGTIYALAVYNGDLIAAGTFRLTGSTWYNHIARWDGSAWQTMANGVDGNVYALEVYNGRLIVAGGFGYAGGDSIPPRGIQCHNIASWDGTAWQPLGGGMDDSVQALTVHNERLVAGGRFTSAGGVTCNNIAAWDGVAWLPLGAGVTGTGAGVFVGALAVCNDQLIVGGEFAAAGSHGSAFLARWAPVPTPAADTNRDAWVDVEDLLNLLEAMDTVPGDPNYNPACDFNADGAIDTVDLLFLVDHWAECAVP